MILKEMSVLRKGLLQKVFKSNVRNLSISKALSKDHYEVLGVKRDATQAEIKNAYFELSKIYHPDKRASTEETLVKFREILAAYEVLGNEQSRKLYDTGLLKKAGVTFQPEGPEDQIIKFYKQRQQRDISYQQGEAMDVWTQEYYGEARKLKLKRNELFMKSKKVLKPESRLASDNFYCMCAAVFAIFVGINLENHPIQKFFKNLFSV